MKNMRIRKFTEAIEANKFQEVIDEVKSLIESTIENSGGEFKSFIDSFIKEPNEVKIEGLINESDIYDFYLKYRNQIDECLNDINFYDNPPSEIGALGLYEYTIKGTMVSVKEFVKQLSNSLKEEEKK
jgi:hypothetical protein